MLTEDEVIDAVRDDLLSRGWTMKSRATAMQHGDDLVAERAGETIVIEAKGAGSSKEGTARYGSEFSSGQVFDHVAKAILKALRVADVGRSRAAIALPDNVKHRNEINQVAKALRRAEVGVFWVTDTGSVLLDAPWSV